MHPTTRSFNGNHLGGTTLEQGAVVAHHQDGGLALSKFLFKPLTGWDIEVVVRLVQQQHVGTRREQQVEHEPLAFASREFRDESRRHVIYLCLHTALSGGLPLRLKFIPAQVTPIGKRIGVPDAVVLPRCHRLLGSNQCTTCITQGLRRHFDQHLANRVVGARHAHVLSHVEHRPGNGELTCIGFDRTRENPQDRALTHAIRSDDGRMFAGCHAKAHIKEELVASWRSVLQFADDDA